MHQNRVATIRHRVIATRQRAVGMTVKRSLSIETQVLILQTYLGFVWSKLGKSNRA